MTLLTATLDDDGPRARLILRFGRIGLALAAGAAAEEVPAGGFIYRDAERVREVLAEAAKAAGK